MRAFTLFLAASLASAVGGTPAHGTLPQRAAPDLAPTACDFTVAPERTSRVRCYTLRVPRDYTAPREGSFDLAVVVVSAAEPVSGRNPVLLLHGGPGGRGLTGAMGRVREDFAPGADLIIFDQRGNGRSDPAVCNDIPSTTREAIVAPGDAFTTAMRLNEPYIRCRARLGAAGIRPEHFGTRVTTEDAERLRRALGVSRWNVMSVSYGTIVALDMIAARPATIGAVVLDSPVGATPSAETIAAEFERPLLNVFAACAGSPACARAYPDLQSQYRTTLAALDARPLIVPVSGVAGLADGPVDLNGVELEYLVRRLMRSTNGIGSIPRVMRAARERDVAAIRPIVIAGLAAVPESNSLGRPAVMCRDIPDFQELRAPRRATDFGQMTGVCAIWGQPGPPPREPRRTVSDVLILVGGLDPLYEPAVVANLAQRFAARGDVVMFPAASHGIWSPGCAQSIVAAFFAQPASPPDPRCVEAQPPIRFEIEGRPSAHPIRRFVCTKGVRA